MHAAKEFYAHLKSAIFNAFLAIEWDKTDSEFFLWSRCEQCERDYNKSVELWNKLSAVWPKQASARVGWIVKRSIAEAGLLWVQDILLAIGSVKFHERGTSPLPATEFYDLMIEILNDCHNLETKNLQTERMDALARLEAEYEVASPPPKEGPYAQRTWRKADGTVVPSKMKPRAFALLEYLWAKESRSATLEELEDEAFGGATIEIDHLQQYASSANKLFRTGQVPWRIATERSPKARAALLNEPPVDRTEKKQKKT